MNLPNVKFNNKNYNLNNMQINQQTKQKNPLYKSVNGQYYESFEEAKKQNMKIYNSFSNNTKR